MAAPSTASANVQPKQMSSRLLNMKFMQRATASKPSHSPKQPTSEPPSKRRRTEFPSHHSTPNRSGENTPLSHFAARVMDERDANAVVGADREGQETAWVLNLNIPQVNGHGDDPDTSEDDIWSTKASGRQTFGGFTRQKKQPAKPARDDADADLSSASEGEVSDSPPVRQQKARTDRFYAKQPQRQVSDTASPLRQHAQNQDRKRKQNQGQRKGREKARKTM